PRQRNKKAGFPMPTGTAPSSRTKSVAIISKPDKPEVAQILPQLYDWLRKHGYAVVIDSETDVYATGPEVVARPDLGSRSLDFVIVLGGDGTLLSTSRAVANPD